MPRVRPLPSFEHARRTLAHKLTPKADRIRQFKTKFGLRSKRVFLVWTQWSGEIRGEGDERERARVELLPTPRVSDLTAISRQPRPTGIWPEGTLRVDEISAAAYNRDNLKGLTIPDVPYVVFNGACSSGPIGLNSKPVDGNEFNPQDEDHVDFFYEIVEDGRGVPAKGIPKPYRARYRLYGYPDRAEASLYFAITLEPADDELSREAGETKVDDLDVFEEIDH